MTDTRLVTDGASRRNPGPAAAGYMILDGGTCVSRHAECIGVATSNEAEYRALLLGLKAVAALGITDITWISDSEVVVSQMKGSYRVRAANLKPLHQLAKEAVGAFDHVRMDHRPRADPRVAEVDAMVKRVLADCIRAMGE